MKRFTLLFLAVFTTGALFAQEAETKKADTTRINLGDTELIFSSTRGANQKKVQMPRSTKKTLLRKSQKVMLTGQELTLVLVFYLTTTWKENFLTTHIGKTMLPDHKHGSSISLNINLKLRKIMLALRRGQGLVLPLSLSEIII